MVISAAAANACIFAGVVGTAVTSNPLIGIGSGLSYRLLTSAYPQYIKRLLEQECTMMKCRHYPKCI